MSKKITWKDVVNVLNPDLHFGKYNKKKALLAFEFGIILYDVARQMKFDITPEIVRRAEEIIEKEMDFRTASQFAGNMVALALAVFEPKEIE